MADKGPADKIVRGRDKVERDRAENVGVVARARAAVEAADKVRAEAAGDVARILNR